MTGQRQATSPLRLKHALRAIRLQHSGVSYQDVVSRSETVETPVISTGPLPIVRASREQIIQAATINPACQLTPTQRELHIAGLRTSMIGGLVQLPGGLYEMYDLFYHELNPSRIMARVRPVEVRS